MASEARWQRGHSDFLTFRDQTALCLQQDETVEHFNDCVVQFGLGAAGAEVWPAELSQTPSVIPAGAIGLIRNKDDDVAKKLRLLRFKQLFPPSRRIEEFQLLNVHGGKAAVIK